MEEIDLNALQKKTVNGPIQRERDMLSFLDHYRSILAVNQTLNGFSYIHLSLSLPLSGMKKRMEEIQLLFSTISVAHEWFGRCPMTVYSTCYNHRTSLTNWMSVFIKCGRYIRVFFFSKKRILQNFITEIVVLSIFIIRIFVHLTFYYTFRTSNSPIITWLCSLVSPHFNWPCVVHCVCVCVFVLSCLFWLDSWAYKRKDYNSIMNTSFCVREHKLTNKQKKKPQRTKLKMQQKKVLCLSKAFVIVSNMMWPWKMCCFYCCFSIIFVQLNVT